MDVRARVGGKVVPFVGAYPGGGQHAGGGMSAVNNVEGGPGDV